MYSNILSGIASGGHYTNWEHFSTMHQAFGSDSGSTLLDATPISGSGLTELRYNTTAPLAMSSPVELNLMENLTQPNPNVPHGTGVLPAEPLLNPLSTSTSTAQLSSSEGVPLLPQNYDNPILQSEILSKSSKLVTESSSDPLPTSATTLLPASATLPNTTVIPATLNIMPTEASQVSNNTPDLLPTLPAAPSVPLAGDLPGAVPLLDPQVSASVVNESSIQQSLNMLQLNDSANLPSNVWMKPDAIFSEPLVRPAYQMTLTDQAVAGAGEYAANSGPIEDLLKCTPPVGLSAITTQPGVMSATNSTHR
ncbi:uncharacterized protein LOC106644213 [Copidosoma floridanum]|uniref:uncharacterized protein LOC106644213 n=1 Tax=Copidosoma floridanum TaxID=29053 RepID=UPI000C6F7D81|nr:uncharacterized protein LOC106644213 [Copidosoma floridanum]